MQVKSLRVASVFNDQARDIADASVDEVIYTEEAEVHSPTSRYESTTGVGQVVIGRQLSIRAGDGGISLRGRTGTLPGHGIEDKKESFGLTWSSPKRVEGVTFRGKDILITTCLKAGPEDLALSAQWTGQSADLFIKDVFTEWLLAAGDSFMHYCLRARLIVWGGDGTPYLSIDQHALNRFINLLGDVSSQSDRSLAQQLNTLSSLKARLKHSCDHAKYFNQRTPAYIKYDYSAPNDGWRSHFGTSPLTVSRLPIKCRDPKKRITYYAHPNVFTHQKAVQGRKDYGAYTTATYRDLLKNSGLFSFKKENDVWEASPGLAVKNGKIVLEAGDPGKEIPRCLRHFGTIQKVLKETDPDGKRLYSGIIDPILVVVYAAQESRGYYYHERRWRAYGPKPKKGPAWNRPKGMFQVKAKSLAQEVFNKALSELPEQARHSNNVTANMIVNVALRYQLMDQSDADMLLGKYGNQPAEVMRSKLAQEIFSPRLVVKSDKESPILAIRAYIFMMEMILKGVDKLSIFESAFQFNAGDGRLAGYQAGNGACPKETANYWRRICMLMNALYIELNAEGYPPPSYVAGFTNFDGAYPTALPQHPAKTFFATK